MKTTLKLKRMLILGTPLVIAGLFTGSLIAQTKPKGKPWEVPIAETKKKNPLKATEVLQIGKEVYIEHCKSCHGASGKGDGSKAGKIDISCGDFTTPEYKKQSDANLYWKTTEGRKPMPGYREKLTDTQRWAVILYTRGLK